MYLIVKRRDKEYFGRRTLTTLESANKNLRQDVNVIQKVLQDFMFRLAAAGCPVYPVTSVTASQRKRKSE
jgi:hypothetical protein